MSKIFTHTGRLVDPLNMTAEDVDIQDIAHALGNQCRYSGHCDTFYSVAQHSILMADMAKMEGVSLETQLKCLLHDAAEAYLSDIPRPLKHLEGFAFYREAEDALLDVIFERFGLAPGMSPLLHYYDQVMLVTEQRDLMPPAASEGGKWFEVPEWNRVIVGWSPYDAKLAFLATYDNLARLALVRA